MRLIIAGGRDFNDFDTLEREVLKFIKAHREPGEKVTIISGRARGADRLGERFANKYGLKIIKKPADWIKYGKKAGFIRNEEMAKIATHVIIFWDGSSKGSMYMRKIAESKKLITKVIRYK